MIEVDLVHADPLLAEQRKPCICCGSDIGGVLVIRESGDLKIARLELEVAIKSIHSLQPLIDRVAKLKADDDARHRRMIKAERERLAQVIGNAPEFRSAPLCREHVPLRCWLKLYEPSRKLAEDPGS